MNAFEKRAQLKDIKPGAILYEVFSITGVKAEMGRKHIITGFPYNHRGIGLFVKCITIYNDWENHSRCSLMDRNVLGRNHYNFHAFFLSEKDAREYVDQINNDNLPLEIREESRKMHREWTIRRADDALWEM
ncbi:hypothetical protein Lw1_gp154 [Escherichia phage Lw1]|uniref:Uncharacterized protein n=2 Tax=Pseudotevenvirus TaxID=2842979 RepID=M9UXV1_9CAUD|nr:hypothetical protein RB16p148 [Escherichia phage RB16]YP_008060676.1 hypothetical protein Lw1_gp154 [Escherichia phage Lw1]ADJ55452.1 conserved hypothetical phage protein [Escherichia phage RB16]AGJ71561.1 hypothetical protein Lw1_gp154 [Escherichia phage Lw1]